MAVPASSWRIDRGLAAALTDALGWSATDGLGALARRIPELLPCGSTAKLDAISAGEVPPGADVDAVATTVLAHLEDPSGATMGGSPAWSCWVLAGLVAAVLDRAGIPAEVAITRRIDEGSPVVDLHASVLAGPAGARWILGPYFGLAAPHPIDTRTTATENRSHGAMRASVGADGRLELTEHLARWDAPLRYRVLATGVDRGDVHTVAAISATLSGVPMRPYARLHRPDGTVVDAKKAEDGRFLVGIWRPNDAAPAETEHPTWPLAAQAFQAATGVAVR